jgi:mannose-1-phosphate guanylyltransferase
VGLNVRVDWETVTFGGPVYLASGSHIESGCEIYGPTWIGHGCHIQRGARIVRSVIFEHTRVERDALFHEQIVCGDYCVNADGEMKLRHVGGAIMPWSDARERAPLAC